MSKNEYQYFKMWDKVNADKWSKTISIINDAIQTFSGIGEFAGGSMADILKDNVGQNIQSILHPLENLSSQILNSEIQISKLSEQVIKNIESMSEEMSRINIQMYLDPPYIDLAPLEEFITNLMNYLNEFNKT